jgi:nitronate monooxygenase
LERYVRARDEGDAANTGIFVGEAAGLINDVRPAADIVRDIAADAERLLARGAMST